MRQEVIMRGPEKMDGKMKVMFMVLLALLIGACATSTGQRTQQLEDNWQGKKVSDLIATKGQPDEKFDDGRGGQIFDYAAYEAEPGSESGSKGTSPPKADPEAGPKVDPAAGEARADTAGGPVGVVPPAAAHQKPPTLRTRGSG